MRKDKKKNQPAAYPDEHKKGETRGSASPFPNFFGMLGVLHSLWLKDCHLLSSSFNSSSSIPSAPPSCPPPARPHAHIRTHTHTHVRVWC